MSDTPTLFIWEGDVMRPANGHWAKRADKEFIVGQHYALVEHHERSSQAHRHYHASVRQAWMNLHEDDAARFPTPEHLRKWALVQAGYRDERTIVASSKSEAQRLAAFIRPMDEFAVVVVRDAVVQVLTAKSQSYRAMPKAEFQESKDKVLDFLAGLIGTTPAELGRAA